MKTHTILFNTLFFICCLLIFNSKCSDHIARDRKIQHEAIANKLTFNEQGFRFFHLIKKQQTNQVPFLADISPTHKTLYAKFTLSRSNTPLSSDGSPSNKDKKSSEL